MAIVRERIKKAWQEFVKFDEKLQEFVSKETETDSASIKRNKKYQRAFGIGFYHLLLPILGRILFGSTDRRRHGA